MRWRDVRLKLLSGALTHVFMSPPNLMLSISLSHRLQEAAVGIRQAADPLHDRAQACHQAEGRVSILLGHGQDRAARCGGRLLDSVGINLTHLSTSSPTCPCPPVYYTGSKKQPSAAAKQPTPSTTAPKPATKPPAPAPTSVPAPPASVPKPTTAAKSPAPVAPRPPIASPSPQQPPHPTSSNGQKPALAPSGAVKPQQGAKGTKDKPVTKEKPASKPSTSISKVGPGLHPPLANGAAKPSQPPRPQEVSGAPR